MTEAFNALEALIAFVAALGYDAFSRPPGDTPDNPDPVPDEYVTVERTGGYVADMVDHPTFAIQCWAQTELRANSISVVLRNALLIGAYGEVDGVDGDISPADFGLMGMTIDAGPYAFFDEYTRSPRYQMVVSCACHLVK